ncbi:alpha-N-acetylgalactosaminide alpha-2,6-sialyltransferase 2 isoform X1 [Phascolarctos cinereus]|uniref:alpha-N-acetylgalactosaminide alpha-2,6-sialyltransferase n=1 Tax=Phascolarctos cinereus TaxID=38626 RepID=A0A6P5LII1_PHACI|nr:alpha-N-acetylgalactosaminide alpha-2,6-sialyltransferase 2 isoform X1 [Phascolarctos cinereus]
MGRGREDERTIKLRAWSRGQHGNSSPSLPISCWPLLGPEANPRRTPAEQEGGPMWLPWLGGMWIPSRMILRLLLLLSAVSSGLLFTFYYSANHLTSSPPQKTRDISSVSTNAWTRKHQSCNRPLVPATQQHYLFKHKFNFSIPVLLYGRLFTQELWDQLSQQNAPYGWRGLSYQAIASTLSLLNTSANAQLFDFSVKQRLGCIRCAVVGNGGILNGSRQGLQIDSHDFVFRLNGAVIKGYEKDVGTKTSFYGFTVNTMKNSLGAYKHLGFTSVPKHQDLHYIFIPSNIRDYLMLKSAVLGVPVPEGHDKGDKPQTYFGPDTSASKFKLLHPEFINYLKERFLKSDLISKKYGYLYMPSTGALMLLTALHTCDQVSAYGFITSNYQEFSDHYYDSKKQPLVFYVNHDMHMEGNLWKNLHDAGIMNLYQR